MNCSSNDDGFIETSIYGTWKAIEYRTGDDVFGAPTRDWEEAGVSSHEITFNEDMTYYYENYIIPSCCTPTNMCLFEIEIAGDNDNRLSRDYDCDGIIDPVEYFDRFYFNGKYLIISSIFYDIGGRQYKYERIKKDDSR